jgi:hypothetical protein
MKVKIYRTIILPVVFCGCETCSITLREEHSLRVFENRVLRRIFGPRRDELMEEWRKLHSGELPNLYLFPNVIRQIKSRKMSWVGYVARMGEERKLYKVFVGNLEGKTPFGRLRYRWEDGLEWILQGLVGRMWSGVTWLSVGTGSRLL